MIGIIKAIKNGWYSGEGFKAIRNKRYKSTIHFFNLTLKNSSYGFEPVIYEELSKDNYHTQNFELAIINAQKRIEQYQQINAGGKYQKKISSLEKVIKTIKEEIIHIE